MSSHFRWYPSSEEVVVPWNARYSFPSQANKAVKITPRIPPKNGAEFNPGSVIRLEFPAQGYVNPANTFISFDVALKEGVPHEGSTVHFQNNIQCIFSRVRLMYGSTPLEDIINYNQVVRNLTEWTATAGNDSFDQTSISEGMGGAMLGVLGTTNAYGCKKIRPSSIQGISRLSGQDYEYVPNKIAHGDGTFKTSTRYQIQLALGLFTQGKLIPTKFMASQLAIELTLAPEAQCLITNVPQSFYTGRIPSYTLSNINLIPEILEFDASYGNFFINVRCFIYYGSSARRCTN